MTFQKMLCVVPKAPPAPLSRFLASNEASFAVGSVLTVDGGMSVR